MRHKEKGCLFYGIVAFTCRCCNTPPKRHAVFQLLTSWALWSGESVNVDAIIDAQGLKQVSDTGALEAMVDKVLAGMPDQVAQYQNEEDPKKRKKMLGGFMGPLMKASKGQGNPKLFNEILVRKLGG